MAKISVKSQYSGELESPHDSWKDWIVEWVPDTFDLLMEKYDPNKGESNVAASRIQTNSENYEGSISAPPAPRRVSDAPRSPSPRPAPRATVEIRTPLNIRRPAPPPADPFAVRRAAARESFQKQVDASRAHVAGILSKLGNAK